MQDPIPYKQYIIHMLRVLHSSSYIVGHSIANTRNYTINRLSRFIRDNRNVGVLHKNNTQYNVQQTLNNVYNNINTFATSTNNNHNRHNIPIQIDIEDDDNTTTTSNVHAQTQQRPLQQPRNSSSINHNVDSHYHVPISSDIPTAVHSNITSIQHSANRLSNAASVGYESTKQSLQEEISDRQADIQPTDTIKQTIETLKPQINQYNNQQAIQSQPATTTASQTHQSTLQQQPHSVNIQSDNDNNTPIQQQSTVQSLQSNLTASQLQQSSNVMPTPSLGTPIEPTDNNSNNDTNSKLWKPREVAVPSSSIGRVWGFGKLAAGMLLGSVTDSITGNHNARHNINSNTQTSNTSNNATSSTLGQQLTSDNNSSSGLSRILSESNAERLAEGLCRMRGAALKVGQILSIQDESVLPPQLQAIFDRVRDRADVMPQKQLMYALNSELGSDWRDKLQSFNNQPIAAASIGQVHKAVLHDNRKVVMKVQYPGVADSINSDINNVRRMITWFNFAPRGLYFDETMNAAKEELGLECDYIYESRCQKKYKKIIKPYKQFYVPDVIDQLTTKRVLTSEYVDGVSIDKLCVGGEYEQSQDTRDYISLSLIELCLTELFTYRFMQTDPNWSNFLYNINTNTINLIDFGACRSYNKLFVDEYMHMVYACATQNREQIIESSIRMGFLTGDESQIMLDAHIKAALIIGEPFMSDKPYDFVAANIPQRVAREASIMLQHRLTPPPKEAYTLHRKLSGAFLTARKLSAKISAHKQFFELYHNYTFDEQRYDAKTMRNKKVEQAVV